MTTSRSFLLLALFGLALTACDSSDDYEIGGTYTSDFDGFVFTLTIPHTESGDTFPFTITGGDDSTTGTGHYDHPDIELTIDGDTIEGTVSEDGDTIQLQEDSILYVFVRD